MNNIDTSTGKSTAILRELKNTGKDVAKIRKEVLRKRDLEKKNNTSPYFQDRVHINKTRLLESQREKEWRILYNENGNIISY